MPHKQEKPISQQNKKKPDFYERTGAVKDAPKILPGGAGGRSKKFHKKFNFDNIKKKFDATGKLDLEDFNSADEIGMFLDWYNQGIKNRVEKEAGREITEISKFLARMIGRTTINLGTKK